MRVGVLAWVTKERQSVSARRCQVFATHVHTYVGGGSFVQVLNNAIESERSLASQLSTIGVECMMPPKCDHSNTCVANPTQRGQSRECRRW